MLYRVLGTDLEKKQKYLLSLAKDAFTQGKKVYILVPEQATALYERLVLEECGLLFPFIQSGIALLGKFVPKEHHRRGEKTASFPCGQSK